MYSLLLVIIYLSFISLGLPDALLGAGWPIMYKEFGVPLSYAGILTMVISAGTVISALLSDRLTKKFGTGLVTSASVFISALSLIGFSISSEFWMLIIWSIPYGLGAGSVDASLNNYVALHYESRHMSWLHCMWGVGISVGPYILSYALTQGMTWNSGYKFVFFIQLVLAILIMFSLPLWKKPSDAKSYSANVESDNLTKALSLREIFRIKGAKDVMLAFFCYCALEQTAILWGASYFVMIDGISKERAASLASLFCIGITVGRLISGFMTYKFKDTQMVRIGIGIILLGIVAMFLPIGVAGSLIGLTLIGFGCAPIYPCIIHSTPVYFGAENSQAVIGVQMASAYIGITFMPPLFGLIANHISLGLLPMYLLILLVGIFVMHESLIIKTRKVEN